MYLTIKKQTGMTFASHMVGEHASMEDLKTYLLGSGTTVRDVRVFEAKEVFPKLTLTLKEVF